MTTDTSERTTPYPTHPDGHAAGLYRAIAARLLSRLVSVKSTAEFYGGDLVDFGVATSQIEAGELYEKAVQEWVFEPPSSATAVKAMVEFAASISADRLFREVVNEGGPVSDEVDSLHQLIVLSAAAGWLTGPANREGMPSLRREPLPGAGGTK